MNKHIHKNRLLAILGILVITIFVGTLMFGCVNIFKNGNILTPRDQLDDDNSNLPNTNNTSTETNTNIAVESGTYATNLNIVTPNVDDIDEPITKSTLPNLVNEVKKSPVSIICDVKQDNGSLGRSAGSGVFIGIDKDVSNRYYIMTCCHVIDNSINITAILSDGTSLNCKLVGGDEHNDIAILMTSITDASVKDKVSIASIRKLDVEDEQLKLRQGDSVFTIGNALGTLDFSVTAGVISGISRNINLDGVSLDVLQVGTSINKGNSGGPLYDYSGLLIGIVNAKSVGETVEGIGYAIPISTAIKIAESLINTAGNADFENFGYIEGKIMLGVMLSFNSQQLNYSIVSISKYGSIPSHNKAGVNLIYTGDVIKGIKVNNIDKPISNSNNLGEIVKALHVNDKVTLTIERVEKSLVGGLSTKQTVDITITAVQYVYKG